MKMIAEKAGVSLMTVSRALKNNPRHSLATRTRIQEIAAEMGYCPNPMVSVLMTQLRSQRTRKTRPTIAFLSAHPNEVYTTGSTYNAQIYEGAIQRAGQLGYNLQKFSLLQPGMTWERICSMLRARGIGGVILAPLPDPIPFINFDWSQFACATVGYSYKKHNLHRVTNDQFNTIRTAIQRLTQLGYKRIGLAIRHEDDLRVENKWTGGFLSFSYGSSTWRSNPVFLWHYRSPEGTQPSADEHASWEGHIEQPKGFSRWLNRYRPDAILSLQPVLLRQWLDSLNLRVPQDIAIGSLNLQSGQSSFSGMDQNNSLLGSVAVEFVVEQIHHNEYGIPNRAKTVTITGDWIDRTTTQARCDRTQADAHWQRNTVTGCLSTGQHTLEA